MKVCFCRDVMIGIIYYLYSNTLSSLLNKFNHHYFSDKCKTVPFSHKLTETYVNIWKTANGEKSLQ